MPRTAQNLVSVRRAVYVHMYYVHVYQLSQRQVTIIHTFLPLLSFLLIYYTIVIIIACKHDAHLNYIRRL